MESALARKAGLERWVHANVADVCSILPLPHDASFRRYFRVQSSTGSLLVMDAPPAVENTRPFIAITEALRALHLATPAILAADIPQGFLLITDFGNDTYLSVLNAENADVLYQRALQALAVLQACREVPHHPLPVFSAEFMLKEWEWHKEWFTNKWLGLEIENSSTVDACYQLLVTSATSQPQVFMHRDYHSGNLMVIPDSVGILDFQDAFMGPITYDLVSLLRDCYIDWPEAKVDEWREYYCQLLRERGVLTGVDAKEFKRWFDWMGMQRHLKALMTFARKHVRDQQPQYLKHVPRTLEYLLKVSEQYPELKPLHAYLRQAERVIPCAQ